VLAESGLLQHRGALGVGLLAGGLGEREIE
jgi:hypothetical protein